MGRFSVFLADSLAVLGREAPLAYATVYEKLGGRAVAIEVDGDALAVAPRWGRLERAPLPQRVVARASSSHGSLVRLLRGDVDLTRAILDGEVTLLGGLEDLAAFYDALIAYFMGAVRCPSFPELIDRFIDAEAPSERAALH